MKPASKLSGALPARSGCAAPDLLALIAVRDEADLLRLFHRAGPLLRGMLARIQASQEEIESVLESAFAELWKQSKSREASGAGAEAWFAITARNLAVSRLGNGIPGAPRKARLAFSLNEKWLPELCDTNLTSIMGSSSGMLQVMSF
ncbi:MAG: sigma factor [Terriglobia bacterium]